MKIKKCCYTCSAYRYFEDGVAQYCPIAEMGRQDPEQEDACDDWTEGEIPECLKKDTCEFYGKGCGGRLYDGTILMDVEEGVICPLRMIETKGW